jgi:hypothetical protein
MKLFFTIVILLIGNITNAQNLVNIFAGAQTINARYKVNDEKQKTQSKFGFQAGIGMKVPFENKLYFTPSVFYNLKGYKVQFNQHVYPPDPDAVNNDVMLHTVDVALLLQVDLGNQADHFFIGFGPSIDFQLFGKEKFKLLNGNMVDRKMKFGFADYGHYTTSAMGRLGYETSSGLLIFVQYNLGLGSINNADGGPTIRHRVFGLSIGKILNSNKIVIDTRNRE